MSKFRYLRPAASLAIASGAVTLAVGSPFVARAIDREIQTDSRLSVAETVSVFSDLAARDDRPPKPSSSSSRGGGSR